MSKELVNEKEEICNNTICNNIIKRYNIMLQKKIKEHNQKRSTLPDHPHRILLSGHFGSREKYWLFNLIRQEPDIDKNYLYRKDP